MPRDPYRNFRFEVEIDGFTHAGFSKVTGLKHSVAVIEYREGGENETMRKLPGQSSFDAVIFERGKSDNQDFISWIEEIFNLDNLDGYQGAVEGWRRTVTVYLRDKSGARVKSWKILNAWPSEVSADDLDGAGNDVLIEKLTLQNEGVKEVQL